jgi:hypothetical protein
MGPLAAPRRLQVVMPCRRSGGAKALPRGVAPTLRWRAADGDQDSPQTSVMETALARNRGWLPDTADARGLPQLTQVAFRKAC